MNDLVIEAYRVALAMEKKNQDFLKAAALMMPAGPGKRVLERLIREEGEVIEQVAKLVPPIQSDLVMPRRSEEVLVQRGHAWESPERRLCDLLAASRSHKAASVEQYQIFLKVFRDPSVCDVFNLFIDLSKRLLRHLTEEHRQAEQRLQRPVANRRTKRHHLKDTLVSQRTPNQHSQLFISLQELGQRPPYS